MTDADLLRLIEEKLPGDLSEAELSALRSRLPESPEIRAALAAALELETDLATGLADVSLSVDDLLMKAASRRSRSSTRSPMWWIIGGLAGILLIVGLGVWWSAGKRPEAVEIVAARTSTQDQLPQPAPLESTAEPPVALSSDAPKSAEAALSATMPADPSPSATSPVAPIAEGPWTPWLNGELAPRPADDPRWRADLRTIGHDEIALTEFQRWWGEIPGVAPGWNEAIIGNRRTIQLDGRLQLKAPWVDDVVLRFTPFDLNDLTLLFGDLERGVALRFYRQREPHLWAAYEFQRPPGETTIKWGGLLTTDGGAWHRSGAATFEVRRQDGMLVLSTGQVQILTVPLEKPPQVVQLLGRGRLRGFSWLRAEPWSMAEREARPVVLQSGDAESAKWQSVKPDTAMVHTDADGAVSLTGTSKSEESLAYVPLPRSTLVESIVRFSAADAGTGFYLGNEQGKPVVMLGIFHDNRAKQLAFGPLRPGDRRVTAEFDPNAFPPPYWTPNVWLKIVAGLGTCHVWSSGDGVHWGHIAENPLHDVNGAVRSIGLYSFPGETPRTIRMDTFRVNELHGLTRLGHDADLAANPELPSPLPASYVEWQAAMVDQLPEQVDPSRWMERAAVATLKAGPNRSLAREIIECLTESSQFQTRTVHEQRQFLDDASILLDAANDPNLSLLRNAYFASSHDSKIAWREWLQSPVWTSHPNFRRHRDSLTQQLLASAFAPDRAAILETAADAQFWMATAHPDHRLRPEDEVVDRLARWARSIIGAPDRQTDGTDVLPLSWRHPLQLTVNKEAYNVRSELRSALLGGTFGDAGRIAMNFGGNDGVGLLPDMDDDQLFVSVPVAMATAVKDYPAFGDALRNDLGPTGLVRVAQAARRGDLETLRAATIQFYGTPAAAEAERVLGDRQMALGDSFGARRCYLRARRSASDDQREALRVRLLLSDALQGGHVSTADAAELATLKLDGVALAPLMQELGAVATAPANSIPGPSTTPPARARYRVEIKSRFDGQVGQNAGKNEFKNVDAFGRQFAVMVDNERFYVSNRFQVVAYLGADAQQLWAASVGSEQGEAHGHRFTSMSPQLIAGNILVRRMTKAGIELACLKPEDGQVLWKTRSGDKADVLSDAVALPGRIGVLIGHRGEEESLEIRWTHLSPATGELIAEFPLVRLRDAWSGEVPCALTVQDDRAVAVVGGVIVGFETTGAVLWVRRETWLPPKIDPQADDYLVSAPRFFMSGEPLVIVSSPSSRDLVGVDFSSGRLKWKISRPMLQGIVAASEDKIVLAENDGLAALAADTGAVLWTRPLSGRMSGFRVDGDRLVVTVSRDSVNNKSWPQLVWLDLVTGALRGEALLDLNDHPDWQVGPFFTIGDAWWTLIGRPGNKPQRDLARLVPATETAPQPWSDPHWGSWLSPLSGDRRLVQSVLPGWQPVAVVKNVFSVPGDPVRDRKPVLIVKTAREKEPVQLVRTVHVGQENTAGLHLRVGHQPGQRWQLEVRINGRTVFTESVSNETAPNGWLDTTVPLFPFAGQRVTLQLTQKNLDAKSPADGLWHELRLTGCEVP